MEELQQALKSLKQLDRDTTTGDIEDKLKGIGSFLYRELDSVICAVESALEVLKDNDEYIAEIEAELEELKSKVGESK